MSDTDNTVEIIAEPLPVSLPSKQDFPFDWYWLKQDGSLFSSERILLVGDTDNDYTRWASSGRIPTPYPKDEKGADSEAELQKVLSTYNLSATLENYARGQTWALRVGGTTIGGAFVPTDAETLGLLTGLKSLAEQDPTGSFPFDDGSPTGRTLTGEEAIGLATAVGQWVQSTFSTRISILTDIANGKIKSKADVDAVLTPKKPTKKSSK